MLQSPHGLEVRLAQQPARAAMFEACVDSAVPGLQTEDSQQAAAALQVLYSASAWDQLRSFWGMDGGQAADVIEQAIRSLLAGLQASLANATDGRSPPRSARTTDRSTNIQLHEEDPT